MTVAHERKANRVTNVVVAFEHRAYGVDHTKPGFLRSAANIQAQREVLSFGRCLRNNAGFLIAFDCYRQRADMATLADR